MTRRAIIGLQVSEAKAKIEAGEGACFPILTLGSGNVPPPNNDVRSSTGCGRTGQSSVIYEAVARCIIEIAKSGERDPQQLRDSALTAVGHKRLIPLPPRN